MKHILLYEYYIGIQKDSKKINRQFIEKFSNVTGIKVKDVFNITGSEAIVFETTDNKILKFYIVPKHYRKNENLNSLAKGFPYLYCLNKGLTYIVESFKTGLVYVSDEFRGTNFNTPHALQFSYGNENLESFFVLQEKLKPANKLVDNIQKYLKDTHNFNLYSLFGHNKESKLANIDLLKKIVNSSSSEYLQTMQMFIDMALEFIKNNVLFTDFGSRQFGIDKNGTLKLLDISKVDSDNSVKIHNIYHV